MNTLYIVIPAYNEAENIANVIDDWYPVIEKHNESGESRLVILNDGSHDETGRILDEEAENRPLLKVIHKENSGHGPTILQGYQYALDQGADYIFQTDGDGQTLAREFEPFWRQRERFDCVIGRRTGRKDGMIRSAISKAASAVLFALFGVNADDVNTPYRIMKAEKLRQYIQYIAPDEPIPNVMLTAIFLKKKAKVLFRTITFRQRQGGKNSIDPGKVVDLGVASVKRLRHLAERLNKEKS